MAIKFTCPTCGSADVRLQYNVDTTSSSGGYIVYQCAAGHEWLATWRIVQDLPALAPKAAGATSDSPNISRPKRRRRQWVVLDEYDHFTGQRLLKGRKLC